MQSPLYGCAMNCSCCQILRTFLVPIGIAYNHRTQELQGHEESREHIDADDHRNDYADSAPPAPTVLLSVDIASWGLQNIP